MLLRCRFFRLLDLVGSYCRMWWYPFSTSAFWYEVRLAQRMLCQMIGTATGGNVLCGDWRVVALAVDVLQ